MTVSGGGLFGVRPDGGRFGFEGRFCPYPPRQMILALGLGKLPTKRLKSADALRRIGMPCVFNAEGGRQMNCRRTQFACQQLFSFIYFTIISLTSLFYRTYGKKHTCGAM